MATLDWSQCPAVESVPGKVSGAWVLKGTRMPVSAIFENLELRKIENQRALIERWNGQLPTVETGQGNMLLQLPKMQ
jgi:hypothetical protein